MIQAILEAAYTSGLFDSTYPDKADATPDQPYREQFAAVVKPIIRALLDFTKADPDGKYWQVVGPSRGLVYFPHYLNLGRKGFMLIAPNPKVEGYALIESEFALGASLGFLGTCLLYSPDRAWLGLIFQHPNRTDPLEREGIVTATISTDGRTQILSLTPALMEGTFASYCLRLTRSTVAPLQVGPLTPHSRTVITGGTSHVYVRHLDHPDFTAALGIPEADRYLAGLLSSLPGFLIKVTSHL